MAKAKTKKTIKAKAVKERIKKEVPPPGFEIIIENYLPPLRVGQNPELKEAIQREMKKLLVGQSFFIPDSQMKHNTVRTIVTSELKEKEFKDKEIRVICNKPNELKGCRVSRFH